MAVSASVSSSSAPILRTVERSHFLSSPNKQYQFSGSFPVKQQPPLTVVYMAPKKKVYKYDDGWKKQWFGAGIFFEGSEEVEVDVFKKLEKGKVLSNVEKAGLLSKAEKLGVTLSSIEKLGVFSKAEELGLLSLLETVATVSPSALASATIPALLAAVTVVVLIPDDSVGLIAVQALVAGLFGVGAAGLFVGSVVLNGIQEAE